MSNAAFKWIPAALLVLGSHAPSAIAQSTPATIERSHADALTSFRQARFPEAYGRFIALANAGHAPSAELALWMYRHGTSVFAREWDSTPEQLAAWTRLAGQPAPALAAHGDRQDAAPVATWTRGSAR
ncbi:MULTISPECIES: hypothetical protein [unclassified Roseateles]|uniref:hypothetical protein n=1 Tax=unclassified Roseateles TaxID=2626991 RepID=UPI0006F4235A|nr:MULTISPECIES: hypothetical protein [unclassified Roseateles]KQW46313.1 hypothetical protein ASC81_07835 [Pelomonas sp. Root405]KRA73362.1 hypothetical protein ASD88_07835 [Pelomonas sp. Root662]